VSIRANPMTDALCREGMVRSARSLKAGSMKANPLPLTEDELVEILGAA